LLPFPHRPVARRATVVPGHRLAPPQGPFCPQLSAHLELPDLWPHRCQRTRHEHRRNETVTASSASSAPQPSRDRIQHIIRAEGNR